MAAKQTSDSQLKEENFNLKIAFHRAKNDISIFSERWDC